MLYYGFSSLDLYVYKPFGATECISITFAVILSNFIHCTWRFGGVVNAIASNPLDSYSSLRAQVRILQASNCFVYFGEGEGLREAAVRRGTLMAVTPHHVDNRPIRSTL
jgi:hypothetical protein